MFAHGVPAVCAPEKAGLAKATAAKSMTLLAEALLEIAFVIIILAVFKDKEIADCSGRSDLLSTTSKSGDESACVVQPSTSRKYSLSLGACGQAAEWSTQRICMFWRRGTLLSRQ